MARVSTPELAAAVAEQGCLGLISVGSADAAGERGQRRHGSTRAVLALRSYQHLLVRRLPFSTEPTRRGLLTMSLAQA